MSDEYLAGWKAAQEAAAGHAEAFAREAFQMADEQGKRKGRAERCLEMAGAACVIARAIRAMEPANPVDTGTETG